MCGISGIIGKNFEKSNLISMIEVLKHRGPDDKGYFINKSVEAGLGHNRLSIIDLSKKGHQPMNDNKRNCFITFNGEIYNYLELKKQIKNYKFETKTDTEVILAAYNEWGDDCVKYLNGMFSFAIWDEKNKKLFCARDRVGIKPFYYTLIDNTLIFSSEIKALINAGYKPAPNWKTWSNYLFRGIYDNSDQTFFEGVYSLNPGNTLIFKEGKIVIKKYWYLENVIQSNTNYSEEEYCEDFLELFKDSVKLRLRSDVPVGVNISGGLDSSSLLTAINLISPNKNKIKSFTSIYNSSKYDEKIYANNLNNKLSVTSFTSTLQSNEVWRLLDEMIWHQESPFGGIATIGYHKLHKKAKEENVTVLLEGQGVDEMLAGYEYYSNENDLDLLSHELNKIKYSDSQVKYQDGTSFLNVKCLNNNLKNYLPEITFEKPFDSNLSNALYRDFKYTKLPRVLRMNDRLSMASSRELREPFLDHRVVEYLFSIPNGMKIKNGQKKYLLRKSMNNMIPNELRLAKKRAVVTPQREWIRNELKNDIRDLIQSDSFISRKIFEAEKVQIEFDKYIQNPLENSFFIWQWVNTELWFRRFID